MERIVAAAIIYDGEMYAVPAPGRHGDCIRVLADEHPDAFVGPDDQGFLTSRPRFVRRVEAKKIAIAANQLNEDAQKRVRSPELFSEDMW